MNGDTVRYSSLLQARHEIKELDTASNPSADAAVLESLYHIAGRIDKHTERTFAPYWQTHFLDSRGDHVDEFDQILELDEPLLSITSITLNGVALVVGTDVVAVPRSDTPITGLRLLSGRWYRGGAWKDAVEVTGPWGCRRGYDAAFIASGDSVQSDPLAVGATALVVGNISGYDAYFRTPRFSPGQVLAVTTGSALELMEVQAAVITPASGPTPAVHTLTVRRSIRGTTAVEHAKDTIIRIWEPEPAIQRASLRWVGLLYKRRGQFEEVTFDGVTATRYPGDMPEEVENILDDYSPYGAMEPV